MALVEMERLDLASREIELAEGQAELVVVAFRGALEAAGAALAPAVRDVMLQAFLTGIGRGDVLGPPVVVEVE